MITKSEIEQLLGQLTVRLGFMLLPGEYERLAATKFSCAAEFADALFRAEGMEPSSVDSGLYRSVLDLAKPHFEASYDLIKPKIRRAKK